MVYSIDELRRIITPIAKKYNIPAVYLFGSYARGEADDKSDVDVLIQRTGSSIKGIIIGALYNDLQESLQKEVDLVTVETLDQYRTKKRTPWFSVNLKNERLLIYEQQ